MRDHVRGGIVQIRFVKTKDNVADIFTKNVSEKIMLNTLENAWEPFIQCETWKGVEKQGF